MTKVFTEFNFSKQRCSGVQYNHTITAILDENCLGNYKTKHTTKYTDYNW